MGIRAGFGVLARCDFFSITSHLTVDQKGFFLVGLFLVPAYIHTHNQPKPCSMWKKMTSPTTQQPTENKPNTEQNPENKQTCDRIKNATPT